MIRAGRSRASVTSARCSFARVAFVAFVLAHVDSLGSEDFAGFREKVIQFVVEASEFGGQNIVDAAQ